MSRYIKLSSTDDKIGDHTFHCAIGDYLLEQKIQVRDINWAVFSQYRTPFTVKGMIENNLSKHWNLLDPFCTFDSGQQLSFRYFQINSWTKWLVKYVYRFLGLNGPFGINCYFHWANTNSMMCSESIKLSLLVLLLGVGINLLGFIFSDLNIATTRVSQIVSYI